MCHCSWLRHERAKCALLQCFLRVVHDGVLHLLTVVTQWELSLRNRWHSNRIDMPYVTDAIGAGCTGFLQMFNNMCTLHNLGRYWLMACHPLLMAKKPWAHPILGSGAVDITMNMRSEACSCQVFTGLSRCAAVFEW